MNTRMQARLFFGLFIASVLLVLAGVFETNSVSASAGKRNTQETISTNIYLQTQPLTPTVTLSNNREQG